jgi:hypothetical protein
MLWLTLCLSGCHPKGDAIPALLYRTLSTQRDPPKRTLFMTLFSFRLPANGDWSWKLGLFSPLDAPCWAVIHQAFVLKHLSEFLSSFGCQPDKHG